MECPLFFEGGCLSLQGASREWRTFRSRSSLRCDREHPRFRWRFFGRRQKFRNYGRQLFSDLLKDLQPEIRLPPCLCRSEQLCRGGRCCFSYIRTSTPGRRGGRIRLCEAGWQKIVKANLEGCRSSMGRDPGCGGTSWCWPEEERCGRPRWSQRERPGSRKRKRPGRATGECEHGGSSGSSRLEATPGVVEKEGVPGFSGPCGSSRGWTRSEPRRAPAGHLGRTSSELWEDVREPVGDGKLGPARPQDTGEEEESRGAAWRPPIEECKVGVSPVSLESECERWHDATTLGRRVRSTWRWRLSWSLWRSPRRRKEEEKEEKETQQKEERQEVSKVATGRRRPRWKQQWRFIVKQSDVLKFFQRWERREQLLASPQTQVGEATGFGPRAFGEPSRESALGIARSRRPCWFNLGRNENGLFLSPDAQREWHSPYEQRRPGTVPSEQPPGSAAAGRVESTGRRYCREASRTSAGSFGPELDGRPASGNLHSGDSDGSWGGGNLGSKAPRQSDRSSPRSRKLWRKVREQPECKLGQRQPLGVQWRRHAKRGLQRKVQEGKVERKEPAGLLEGLLSMEGERRSRVEQAGTQRGEQREGRQGEVKSFRNQSALPPLEGRSLGELGVGLWSEFLDKERQDKTSELFKMDAIDSQWLRKMCQSIRASRERRELFPLPTMWNVCVDEVKGLDFSPESSVDSYFETTVRCWCELSVAFVNFLYGRFLGTFTLPPTKAQREILSCIEKGVRRMLSDDCCLQWGPEEIGNDLKKRTLSYTGEEIAKAESLSIVRVRAALPPENRGGKIPVERWLSGKTRWLVENPLNCVLPDTGQTLPKLQAKVHIVKGDERGLADLLIDRGICTWVHESEVFCYRGQKVLNGLFGVEKGSLAESGETALRCIMNLIPLNSVLREIEGKINRLPTISQWLNVHLASGEQLRLYQNDMVSAFYLFAMPSSWSPLMCFNLCFESRELQHPLTTRLGKYYLACRVLPMGWASAVGVMQQVAEEVLLSNGLDGERQVKRDGALPEWMVNTLQQANQTNVSWWQVYLDNFAGAEKSVDGLPGLGRVEQIWSKEGILSAEKKRVSCAAGAVELGAFVGGKGQWIGASTERLLKTVKTSLWLLARKRGMNAKHWQIILGRWVFCFQFRRPCMSLFEQAWEISAKKNRKSGVFREARRELLMACFSLGLCHTWLGAMIDDNTTCSDASMSGGAVAVSKSLTLEGSNFLRSQTKEFKPLQVPVYVISLFNGIGGSLRAYDVAGVPVKGALLVDIHKPANRVCSRRWPFADIWEDIRLLKRERLEKFLLKAEPFEEIHIWAGFPCVDLSSAKADRLNLEGEHSSLIHEAVRIFEEVKQLFPQVVVHFVVENVASMDMCARDEITNLLGVTPIKLDPGNQIPMNRPRFCWTTVAIFETEEIWLEEKSGYLELSVEESWPEAEQWLTEGCWQLDASVTYPTCMKAIRRSRPPPRPAGIDRTDHSCRERWKADNFKYPPYQYKEQYLIGDDRKQSYRLLSSAEREILMGFGAKHTELAYSASKAKQDPRGFEDERCSLVGDSFAIPSFMIIAAFAVLKWTKVLSVSQLNQRLGLPPGAGLHFSVPCPMNTHGLLPPLSQQLMPVQCLHHFLLRHANHTGSDVRIITGELMDPSRYPRQSAFSRWWSWTSVFATRWKFQEHINGLEIRAVYLALLWKARERCLCSRKLFHLTDSYVAMSILSKGRTSSKALQPLVRKIAALLLSGHGHLILAHLESTDNPTDEGSRQGQVGKEKKKAAKRSRVGW